MNWFTGFLTSRFSGWLALLVGLAFLGLSGAVIKGVYSYKELQRRAAFCDGQLESLRDYEALQNRIIRELDKDTTEVTEEIEALRDEAELERENEEFVPPTGCAAERAPDSVIRYHRERMRSQ